MLDGRMDGHGQGKPNDLKVFGSMKIKGPN
jgi:hypothetical protein